MLIAGAILWGGSAQAFVDSTQFFAQTDGATLTASTEGIYFTGAPRWSGLTCRECHTGGPNLVRVSVSALPATLFTDGYQPGQTYAVTVALENETLGLAYDGSSTCTESTGVPYVQCNNNNFSVEIDDDQGPTSGAFCSVDPGQGSCPSPSPSPTDTDQVVVAPGGDAVFGNRAHDPNNSAIVLRNDPKSWQFYWTAPAAGQGSLTLYAAVVDGNGGADSFDDDQDPFGDDVAVASIRLREAGAPVQSAGCSTESQNPAAQGWGVAALALMTLAFALRRARRWR